jgi:hypothetical protein
MKKNKFDIRLIAAGLGMVATIFSAIWGLHEMSHRDENAIMTTNRAMSIENRAALRDAQQQIYQLGVKVAKLETKVGLG